MNEYYKKNNYLPTINQDFHKYETFFSTNSFMGNV